MLGVKLLTKADRTVAALHARKGKEEKKNTFVSFTWSTEIISALEFRHKQGPRQDSIKFTNEKMFCSHNPPSLSKLELLPLPEKKNDIRGKSEKVGLAQIISIFNKRRVILA